MSENKNISVKEYNKMVADEEQVQLAIIEANKKLFDADIAPLKDYDTYYLKRGLISHDLSEADDAEDILIAIAEYKATIAELPEHQLINESIDIDLDTNYGDGCTLDEFNIEYNYYTLYPDDSKVIDGKIKAIVTTKIEEALQPSTAGYSRSISCGLLDKFKAGRIDWLTMQEIVYSDCKINK